MHKILVAAVALSAGLSTSAFAEMTVGVSWSNFQEERWKTDEAAIKGALEAPSIFRPMRNRLRPSSFPISRR